MNEFGALSVAPSYNPPPLGCKNSVSYAPPPISGCPNPNSVPSLLPPPILNSNTPQPRPTMALRTGSGDTATTMPSIAPQFMGPQFLPTAAPSYSTAPGRISLQQAPPQPVATASGRPAPNPIAGPSLYGGPQVQVTNFQSYLPPASYGSQPRPQRTFSQQSQSLPPGMPQEYGSHPPRTPSVQAQALQQGGLSQARAAVRCEPLTAQLARPPAAYRCYY